LEQLISLKMGFKNIFLLLSLVFFAAVAYGQKVKYKDLFLLLNSKQYGDAEPFLRKFLKDNPDHPNGLLYMGIIFQERSNKDDVLKQTEVLQRHIDSAVLFYEKAYKEIDEKEVKRNDEYYENYKRRDLRTGDFAIKLSDIQFDIEKRIQGLKERKTRTGSLKQYFTATETLYGKTNSEFKALQSNCDGIKELLLRSDESTFNALNRIVSVFDSCLAAFKNYKATSQLLGKTGYNQILTLQVINDFKNDGTSLCDFTQDDLKLWDYKSWAQHTIQIIEKEINPMRESLISYDIEINKIREKLKKDSVDLSGELTQLAEKAPTANLKKIDSEPLPSLIFDMKIADLLYASRLIANKPLKDSSNVSLQLGRVDRELKLIDRLDSLSALLLKRDLDKEGENYKDYVASAYGTLDVLKSLIKTTSDFANRERLRKHKEWEYKSQALKWIIYASDSIPLFADETTLNSKFKLLVMVPEDHTMGLRYADSVATGYFFTITSSRMPDVKASFPVDKVNFTRRNLPIIKGLTTKDEKGQVYFGAIYSEAKIKDKFSVVIAKVYRSDGLAWSHTYLFDMLPASLAFDPSTSELSVKTVSPTGDSKMVVLDKNGKLLQ
jgi:hypothetical protein